MPYVPPEVKERIKREVSIQRLAEARGIKLTRSGKELIGLCPFHDDRNPSLNIDPVKNVWSCKGACGEGGDVILWVMRAESVSFHHALELLKRDHFSLTAGPIQPIKTSTVRKLPPLIDATADDKKLLGIVVDYYHRTLQDSPEAERYLVKRGLQSGEIIDRFKLGYANRTLCLHLPAWNRAAGEAQRTRLKELGILRNQKPGHEHFNGSLVIPVFNLDGEVVYFLSGAHSDAILYLVATDGVPKAGEAAADNPAIALLAVVGNNPPGSVVINEMTTVASVWTSAQFLDGTALKGHALGLKIAAGNVPNFVDLSTGGWGGTIQDSLNSSQTPTMANFATLADVLSGCVTQVMADACSSLFAAATAPAGAAPTSTLTAAESIARASWYKPERVFALLDAFYPLPKGKFQRPVPFMPYLSTAPSAWVLPLKIDGGGFRAGGKAMFDSEGNLWVGDNFTVGWQAQDTLWQGNFTKFAPNGKPLSPMTTGFQGGGMAGGTFGAAVDGQDNVWLTSYGGLSIGKFDKNGKSLAGPDGITLNGQLGLMQGVIVTPSSDVWVVGISKNQLVYIPKGDPSKAKLVCEGFKDPPCKSFVGPFHLGIDQQDRIWVTSAIGDSVVRFPASDPTKVETFKTGFSGSGLGIDSQGNIWVTNRLGSSARGGAAMEAVIKALKSGGNYDEVVVRTMAKQKGGPEGGSVTLLRPDGSQYPGSPFTGGGIPGPWAAAVDGNDNVWVSNFAMPDGRIVQLCGVKTENCPPGMKTGDQISPPGGYVGGGLQMETDIAIDPAGNVWVINNWQNLESCFGYTNEALSTLCGGQGAVIFYGIAKPVRAPQIGPAKPY